MNTTNQTTTAGARTQHGEETSLSKLSDHDWHMLSNTWARGVDWYVRKIGRKWAPIEKFGAFPLFNTKREAEAAATTLLLWESSLRAKGHK